MGNPNQFQQLKARCFMQVCLLVGLCTIPTATAAFWDGRLATLGQVRRLETTSPLHYQIAMPKPHRHEFHVKITVRDATSTYVDFVLPKWNPGAYRLTEAHRNIRGLRAFIGSGQKTLSIQKLDEIRWRVHNRGKPFTLEYRVYADKYNGIDGAFLDDATAFFNGVYVFMYVEGQKDRPIDLRIDPLPKTKVITGMNRRGRYYLAKNYDELVDMPVQISQVDLDSFKLGNAPVRIAVAGKGNYDRDRLRSDIEKICRNAAAIFGDLATAIPFEHYTFIFNLKPKHRAGLEHRNSTVISADPWMFDNARKYSSFLGVVAHEFFHLWNVKRIRPKVLGPFAYDREVHTRMLWFSEGVTSYYSWLILSRSQLVSEQETLESIARYHQRIEQSSARAKLSVEQSSWETWLTPTDSKNSYYSYYTKGALIGVVLDLQLRHSTRNQRSLDTIFRELWLRFQKSGDGFSPSSLENLLIEHAGSGGEKIRQILQNYVHGISPMDLNSYLNYAGYRIEVNSGDPEAYLGVKLSFDEGASGSILLASVRPGGAADKAGLANGDVLLAIDGQRLHAKSVGQRLRVLKTGTHHWVSLFRGERLMKVRVKLGVRSSQDYRIVPVEKVSPEQLTIRKSWLGLHPFRPSRSKSKDSVRATTLSVEKRSQINRGIEVKPNEK